jgi:hypothetical protein
LARLLTRFCFSPSILRMMSGRIRSSFFPCN